MTNEEVQERLSQARALIADALQRYVGEVLTPDTVNQARAAVRQALLQLDLATPPPNITDLVEVVVEQDPYDPTLLSCYFRRKS